MMNLDWKKLEVLMAIPTPSGEEKEGQDYFNSIMSELDGLKKEFQDNMGNSVWSFGEGDKSILVSGHIDEICCIVGKIDDSGYITLNDHAGFDDRAYYASQMVILNDRSERINAEVCVPPIHVWWHADSTDLPRIHELKVSVGASSKEEVEKLGISVGNLAVFKRNIDMGLNGSKQIVGNALDDKVGVFMTYEIAKLITSHYKGVPPQDVTYVFASLVQEESGLRGAERVASEINPTISIDIDTTFCTEGADIDTERYGEVNLGKGAVIEFGQDKSRRLSKILSETAKTCSIPVQTHASKCDGTNTAAIQLRSQAETTLLSIPTISLHTPNEIVHKDDIESGIRVIFEAIKGGMI